MNAGGRQTHAAKQRDCDLETFLEKNLPCGLQQLPLGQHGQIKKQNEPIKITDEQNQFATLKRR
eukprot:607934-Amphidinium_carterae.1